MGNEELNRESGDYEPGLNEDGYDGPPGPRILWGRIVVLVIILQLAFFLGRCTSSGVPESKLQQTESQLKETKAELERAKASPPPLPSPSPTPSPEPSASATASPSPSAGSKNADKTYVIKPGDTLASISRLFYGTTDYANALAQFNSVSPGALTVGSKLTIPGKPGASPSPT